jgi:dUTP pyrophosphatase
MQTISGKKLDPEAKLPERNHATDCGLDLFALETVEIWAGHTEIVRTGIALQIPIGYVGKIEDRSSMAARGLKTAGGIIDPGYTGEIKVVINNLNNLPLYIIHKGDKIAQLLIYKIETPQVEEVTELLLTDRDTKGFGSSGK